MTSARIDSRQLSSCKARLSILHLSSDYFTIHQNRFTWCWNLIFQCEQQQTQQQQQQQQNWAPRMTTQAPQMPTVQQVPQQSQPDQVSNGGADSNRHTPSTSSSPKEADLTSIWSTDPSGVNVSLSNVVNVSLSNALSEKLNIKNDNMTPNPPSTGINNMTSLNTLANMNRLQVSLQHFYIFTNSFPSTLQVYCNVLYFCKLMKSVS